MLFCIPISRILRNTTSSTSGWWVSASCFCLSVALFYHWLSVRLLWKLMQLGSLNNYPNEYLEFCLIPCTSASCVLALDNSLSGLANASCPVCPMHRPTQPHCLRNSTQSDWIWLVVGCQGNDSTSDEQGAAAAAAVQLDDKFNGEPVQIRVCEGKEPDHFFSIFNRQLLIYQVNHEKKW